MFVSTANDSGAHRRSRLWQLRRVLKRLTLVAPRKQKPCLRR